jgi:hypothetical protein
MLRKYRARQPRLVLECQQLREVADQAKAAAERAQGDADAAALAVARIQEEIKAIETEVTP